MPRDPLLRIDPAARCDRCDYWEELAGGYRPSEGCGTGDCTAGVHMIDGGDLVRPGTVARLVTLGKGACILFVPLCEDSQDRGVRPGIDYPATLR